MSALADALVAAQRRAVQALEKAYVAGAFENDGMRAHLDLIGCTDAVDQDRLIASLDVIRLMGASLPSEPAAAPQEQADELMTPAQRTFIDKLWSDQSKTGMDRPDLEGLTKARASELITQLKAGTYDPAAWSIPF